MTISKVLFENDYCKIFEDSRGKWFREDKIIKVGKLRLPNVSEIFSYFDSLGNLIKHPNSK